MKECRVLNDSKGLFVADLVSILFDVIPGSPYRIFCFVGDATQLGLVRNAFFVM